jgi:hypothetical protein
MRPLSLRLPKYATQGLACRGRIWDAKWFAYHLGLSHTKASRTLIRANASALSKGRCRQNAYADLQCFSVLRSREDETARDLGAGTDGRAAYATDS